MQSPKQARNLCLHISFTQFGVGIQTKTSYFLVKYINMAAGYVRVLPASAVETVLLSVKHLYGNGSKDTSKKGLKNKIL